MPIEQVEHHDRLVLFPAEPVLQQPLVQVGRPIVAEALPLEVLAALGEEGDLLGDRPGPRWPRSAGTR